MKLSTKEINQAADAHAKEVLGEAEFKSNRDAAKSIAADFADGVKWAVKKAKQEGK